jgi:hypothetical protein
MKARAVAPSFARRLAIAALTVTVLALPRALPAGAGGRHPEADGLAHAARQAADAIRLHQKPGGYWANPTTPRPVFAQPVLEANTFVPAVVLELIAPIARETGLADAVERARGYLRDQFEENGLVRYHGRPGVAYIQPFVCVITPDSDDTALAWRLASPNDATRLRSALRVLERYRTEDGLYRTWLSSREAYQCVEPGEDPNPADVGINMHLYLFFARYDPPAARALCQALRRTIAEDRIWVYYKSAPLVPLLREADLARAGCRVRVPGHRLQTVPAGQERYLALARALAALVGRDAAPPAVETVVAGLKALADASFERLRETPPLLYHNDLSAATPRFHWSEDVGYALWLRVYLAAGRRWPERLGPVVKAVGP